MTALVRVDSSKLAIERLAEALEHAASVDEISDIRDRAMAIALYVRKKEGGIIAERAATKIVEDATTMLGRLYAEERSASRRDGIKKLDREQVSLPGKKAIAEAAGMDPAALSRIGPLAKATPEAVDAARAKIEARGDIATVRALVRELKPEQPKKPTPARETVVIVNGHILSVAQGDAVKVAIELAIKAEIQSGVLKGVAKFFEKGIRHVRAEQ